MPLNCALMPCLNCPYRMDAPLAHWDVSEFLKVLVSEADPIGKAFGCHKQNGKLCTGWVMNQDEHNEPKAVWHMAMRRSGATRAELDALHCPVPRYATVEEMCIANFPHLSGATSLAIHRADDFLPQSNHPSRLPGPQWNE